MLSQRHDGGPCRKKNKKLNKQTQKSQMREGEKKNQKPEDDMQSETPTEQHLLPASGK